MKKLCLVVALVAAALAGCTASGDSPDNPVYYRCVQ